MIAGTQRSGNGGLAGTRTPDQCLKRALLYQLSYQPKILSLIKLRRLTNDFEHCIATRACNPSAFVLSFLHKNDEQKRIAAGRATSVSQGCKEPLPARIIGRILCPTEARRQAVSRSLKTKDGKLADRRLNGLRAKIGCREISPDAKLTFEQAANLWLETNKHALNSNTVKRREMPLKGLTPFFRTLPTAPADNAAAARSDCPRTARSAAGRRELRAVRETGVMLAETVKT